MQDRYAGDIGDFAKFCVLRVLCGKHEDSRLLRLGVLWYLTSFHSDPSGHGKHTGYLDDTPRNYEVFRACDVDLYDRLARIVHGGDRRVSVIPKSGILPSDTAYYSTPLQFQGRGIRDLRERRTQRSIWLAKGLEDTVGCDIVFADPDNGLQVKSIAAHHKMGPKYVFLEELAPYVQRGQSAIVYQHATRQGKWRDQVRRRFEEMRDELSLASDPFALLWRSISPRTFFVIPSSSHRAVLHERAQLLILDRFRRHFELLD